MGAQNDDPLRYSGPPKKGGPHKIAVWGSAFWRLQSLFPPKGQSIWGSKSGAFRSVPVANSACNSADLVARFRAAKRPGRPAGQFGALNTGINWRFGDQRFGDFKACFHLKASRFGAPNPTGAFRSVPKRSGAFRSPIPLAIRPIWGSKSGRGVPERSGAFWSVPERSGAFRSPIPLAIRPIWGPKSGRSVPERSGAFRWPIPLAIRPTWWPDFGPRSVPAGRPGQRLEIGRFGGPKR